MKRRESFRRSDQTPPVETTDRNRGRRAKQQTRDVAPVPPVLPVVVAEARGEDLVLTVGDDKDDIQTVPRGEVGAALARIVSELGVPTRVEVHEADGRVLVDILDPPHEPEPEHTKADALTEGEAAEIAGLVDVSGDGFRPGEAVAVAVILRHISADSEGVARTLVDPALVPGAGGAEVVMIGRISDAVAVRPLT
ncbi:hypothetical protein [Nesterenkonia alkaliphila]|uniref:Uncharacterized protein n=1 Tax=Nesterenkonia alkaliphila TaxID=1463631 RepID=A0A7K1UF11_9MICC|nr:hypothetical protein [Nesterenkonia alkaliphila]MVT25063.1 hypothetical protein [Nesterenkonia alkaliphila]